MNEPKRRGRPPKVRTVEVVPAEGETPATVVRPEPEPEHDPNPVAAPLSVLELLEAQAREGDADLSAAQNTALDRDFDGFAGGSRPKASLSDLQREAFIRDAIDAYQGQWEIKRSDGFNRVWTFRHEVVKNHDMMLLRVERSPTMAERLIPSGNFTGQHAEAAILDLDKETER